MSIKQLFGDDGSFANNIQNFQSRPQQLALAEAIESAIENQGILIAEAGTGTGKTYAYLVPALLAAKKVLISTGTKNLQDQLYKRDIPEVLKILDLKVKVRLLKGRGNYLCLYRYHKNLYSKISRYPDNLLVFAEIQSWLTQTKYGELAELLTLPERSQLRPLLNSTPDNCLGVECDYHGECFVYKARRSALEADVLVINHHLLFADMALKQGGFGEILPKTDVIVVDESHQIPEIAGRFFSEVFSSRQCQELLKDMMSEASEVDAAFAAISDQHQWFERALRDMLLAMSTTPKKGTLSELLKKPEILEYFELLQASLSDLSKACANIAVQSSGLDSCYLRITSMEKLLEDMLLMSNDEFVYWYENSNKYFSLCKSPLEVAGPLTEFRSALDVCWILTSATLAVNNSFEHYQQQTGFFDSKNLLLDSPFDYQNNALLLLPKTLPQPNDYDFNQQVFEYVLPIIEQAAGGVFFLFTSHKSLQSAAQFFANRINRPIFVQGTDDRNRILKNFRECGNGLLLGAASFWEGVDVTGQSLSCVIIDKLPFAHPDDPVLQAKINHSKKNGGNPFFDQQIPKAIIALKQGAGRLIRGEKDQGVLVICDQRISSKGYGKMFLNSLPAMKITHEKDDVLAFFEHIKT